MGEVRHGSVLQGFARHLVDGSGEVGFLLRTVTDNNDLLQLCVVGAQRYLHLVGSLYGLCGIAHIGNGQLCFWVFQGEAESTVDIRHGAIAGSCFHNAHSDKRLAFIVDDAPACGGLLLGNGGNFGLG